MSTTKDAVVLKTDPLTRRIYTQIAQQGMRLDVVHGLIGMSDGTWRRRAREGNWHTSEAQAIARVIGVPFHQLIGLTDEDVRAGAA